jgi:gliding motility-associated-like protein
MKLSGIIFTLLLSLPALGQTLNRAEYFFDSDPGKGNGTSLTIPHAASIHQTFNINISSLSAGTHTFNIRFVDSNGHWSLFDSRIFFVLNTAAALTSSSINRVEYFFDNDPGTGKATALTISAAGTQNNTFVIGLGSLTQGFHQLTFRYQDNLGHWSLFANRTFYIVSPAAAISSTTLKKAEYFFDNDPGVGKGNPLPITAANPENNLFAVNISSLTSGFHQLAIRYQDNTGKWSLFANRTFYIVPNANAVLATSLKRAEYFFDNDPGLGKGTSYPITAGSPQNDLFAINISSLSSGFHQLCLRYQDNLGRWSVFTNRTFYIVPNANAATATSIKKAEYFFDQDPGVGHGTAYPVTPGNPQNDVFAVNINSLSSGFHQLCLRFQDNLGKWSTFTKRTFYVVPGSVITKTVQELVYLVDTNPTKNPSATGTSLSFTPAAQINQQFGIDLSGVPNGNHKLYLKAKDSQGYWSAVDSAAFTILNCVPPSAPLGSGASRCGSGTVTLSASGASGSQSYRWYATSTSNSVLASNSSFTTPYISKDSSFYASVYDPSTSCESNRTSVTATVVNIPKPSLSPSGSLTVCAGNSVALTAPSGFVSYNWSNGLTGSTSSIVASTSGSYAVTVSNGNCTSPPSDPFVFTVNSLPPKPTINATGGGTLCSGGTITLSVTSGYPIYSWSTGQNASSFQVNTTGEFYVRVTDANGCQSIPSDIFIVTSSAPAKPTILVTGSTTLCNGSDVTLAVPSGFLHYAWSNGDTLESIKVNSAGKYTVSVSNGKCVSPLSDTIQVSIISIPSKPPVQITGNAVLCNNSFVGLTAPPGFSSYLWSDGETSRQIVVSKGGEYSVKVGNASNCLSAPSDSVNVILSGQPCITTNPNNIPPFIGDASIELPVRTQIAFDLKPLITKGSAGIDFQTLRVATSPASGAKSSIDSTNLLLDYTEDPFVGEESIGIQICDSLNSCTERSLTIIVTASVEVFNAVSPFKDGLNDFLNLKYIDKIEETKSNKVTIVDRWGNEVFSISDYNNSDRVFTGNDNNGKELPSGTYYYRIDFTSGKSTLTGFISLKR